MTSELSGSRVVVTGGTSGIGLAIAKRLQSRGAKLVVASRSESNRAAAKEVLGSDAKVRTLDVSDEAAVAAFFDDLGPIDHLITPAAIPVAGPFRELPVSSVRDLVESKFWGQYICARHAAAKIKAGGSITFFSGIVSRKPLPGMSAFAAVGGAIESLTRVLALELAPIRVNCITPGVVDTPAWSFLPEAERGAQLEAIGQGLPVKRVGRAEDLAEAVAMLVSNGFMTGAIVDVDGGHRVT